MTPDFDKTMDDLLRQHGRRATTRPGGAAPSGAGAHLDADALNAFVENALPRAARLRYVSHLADCAACRKFTTDLTLASGVNFQEEGAAATESVKPPTVTESESSWRAWFAALFNPAVLRYAAPAVLLLAVSLGAFLALRTTQNANERVARTEEAPAVTAKNEAAPPVYDTTTANKPAVAPSPQLVEPVKPSPNTPAPTATAAPLLSAPQDAKNAPAERQDKDLRDVSKERKEVAPERDAAPPSPTLGSVRPQPEDKPIILSAPPKPAITNAVKPPSGPQRGRDANNVTLDGVTKTDDEELRAEANKRENRADSASGGRGPAKTPMADGGLVASKPAASPASKTGEESDDRARAKAKKQSAPETRNAGGRAFIRRGGAWVDTACANGCATTTLKRGTDDYKKADSGLRAIADQLGGEVVVLWQGKAYRIQ